MLHCTWLINLNSSLILLTRGSITRIVIGGNHLPIWKNPLSTKRIASFLFPEKILHYEHMRSYSTAWKVSITSLVSNDFFSLPLSAWNFFTSNLKWKMFWWRAISRWELESSMSKFRKMKDEYQYKTIFGCITWWKQREALLTQTTFHPPPFSSPSPPYKLRQAPLEQVLQIVNVESDCVSRTNRWCSLPDEFLAHCRFCCCRNLLPSDGLKKIFNVWNFALSELT